MNVACYGQIPYSLFIIVSFTGEQLPIEDFETLQTPRKHIEETYGKCK